MKKQEIEMFLQAITTKYYGPGNIRGSRVKAVAEAGSITLAWDHRLNVEANHARAAEALARKFGWEGSWIGGACKGSGYCFINTATADPAFTVSSAPAESEAGMLHDPRLPFAGI